MGSKKAVMGIYWVVTAAIALIILLFMISVIKGGVGGSLTDMFDLKDTVTGPLQKEKMKCQHLCNQAKASSYTTVSEWKASSYCTRAASIDLDGDGTINASQGETLLHCWNASAANVNCQTELENGTIIDEEDCR